MDSRKQIGSVLKGITMKYWLVLLLTLPMSTWGQSAKAYNENYAPAEWEIKAVCGAYFSGLRHRPTALYRIGLTEEQYF